MYSPEENHCSSPKEANPASYTSLSNSDADGVLNKVNLSQNGLCNNLVDLNHNSKPHHIEEAKEKSSSDHKHHHSSSDKSRHHSSKSTNHKSSSSHKHSSDHHSRHHSSSKDKHKSNDEHKSSKPKSDKDRSVNSEKSKDSEKSKSESHKSKSDKHHKDSDRHKDGDKNKEKHKYKDGEKHKHKESKHKEGDKSKSESSSKHKDSEKSKDVEKHKDSKHKDGEKHKDSSSSSKHKNGEKHKDRDRHKDSKHKDGEKHKHGDSKHKSSSSKHRSSEKHKSSDKHESKKYSGDHKSKDHKSKHKNSEKEKPLDESMEDFQSERKKDMEGKEDLETRKNESDESKMEIKKEENSSSFTIMGESGDFKNSYTEVLPIKSEPASQMKEEEEDDDDDDDDREKLYIEEQPMEGSVKDESMNEDDLPLSSRLQIKQEEEDDDDDDDEPLLARVSKLSSKSSKKRKKDEDSDFDESDDSGARKPPKKKKKSARAEASRKGVKRGKSSKDGSTSSSPRKKMKKEEEEQDVWKWWEDEQLDDGQKWRTLSHKGPIFAPLYEPLPKSVKFYYNGKAMELSEEAEEVAGFYARMLEHDYVTKDRFNNNFFKDWRKVMKSHEVETIKDLSKCNFKEIADYYKMKSEERKAMTKEEKLAIKQKNEELTNEYGFCIIDGHKQKIGNFRIEPPGLFRGRGEHPKMGMLKRRVQPEDVIINIGSEAKTPPPPNGHKWKEVRHDNAVTWLASWTENILGQTKYIMLNPSSKLKGQKDWQKYETARRLKALAPKIREEYQQDWKSKEMKVRQRAVALYFIDKLALRAGNEKEESETADTVGCCSLRVEHIELHREKGGKEYVVDFDFLGKDSIRYNNSVPVEKQVFKNLKLFMENKQPGDDLFDRLNTAILNKHLNELMEGLTAKVFRTYNASKTLQEQLDLLTKAEMSGPEKLLAYNRANRAVAILCNHQRSVPKAFSKQMESLQQKLNDKKDQIHEVKKELKQLKKEGGQVYERKKKRLKQLEDQLLKLEVQATDKEENKQIALGTSKLNYLDPRISVAWCKKWEVPIEKIYNKTQRDKFRWAIEMAEADYSF